MGSNRETFWTAYLVDVIVALFLIFLVLLVHKAEAQPIEPEVALHLLIDVSSSVSDEEYRLQKEGTVAALTGDEFWHSMGNTPIAIALTEWADNPVPIIPWTLVTNQQEMKAVLLPYAKVERPPVTSPNTGGYNYAPHRANYGITGLGKAMMFGVVSMEQCGCPTARQIIDVSGDGMENAGGNPKAARDLASSRNITINGLAIINEEKSLREYYEEYVVTPGDGFAVEANDFKVYENVLLRKLLLEVS